MNQFDDVPPMGALMERDLSGFDTIQSQQMPVPYAGVAMIQQANRDTTARKVVVPRDEQKILAKLNVLCGTFGDQYVYSWPVKNKKKGQKDVVEGGTIKLANALARAYGNCQVDCDVTDSPTHLIFKAFFIDYETGLSTARLFQQRKNQNTGMGDTDRQADIIFQIGQSKAIRNVIINALSDFAQHAVEQSKAGVIKKFESQEAREIAHDFIDRVMSRHEVSENVMVAVIGRLRKDWDVRNLAKAYMLCKGVAEGMVSPAEAFPSEEYAEEQNTDTQAENEELRSGAARKKVTSAKPKKDEPKTDTQAKPDLPVQPSFKAAGPDATANAELAEAFLKSLDEADNFERIQELRGDIAKATPAHFDPLTHEKLMKGYEAAMARVKKANAAKAQAQPQQTQQAQQATSGQTDAPTEEEARADPEIDEEDVISRIEGMFEGLTKLVDVEATRDKAWPVAKTLSGAGLKRVEMIYNTAQHAAKAKEAEAKPGPSTASMAMFGDDD